jgi:hypothetical protein
MGMKKGITHADLSILGASGKVFSIGAEAYTTNVQITVFVRLVIDQDAIFSVVSKLGVRWYLQLG